MQNEHGQGTTHAQGETHVPGKVQQKAPTGLEESLPNKVHDTGSDQGGNTSGRQTHAKEEGGASVVPKPIQRAVPEKLERVLPNAIHNTGDTGGLHRESKGPPTSGTK
ncbi:hypothetical protein BS50DRAFT_576876 [Corynespora cassiicola Philippines]|uniref:Uncharacterized protein n=1 Tax=Corynespora cassiicola Philippines TaxID=1448308 RepID=A0A2T2NC99_CORCC|nr:hypothetical protein BS50DRAFT_576876 [Corynespora cassiicola Philippines]